MIFCKTKIWLNKCLGPEQLKKSTLIAQRKTLLRGWRVSFQINPFGTVKGWSNIIHATIGKNSGRYGDRIPGIWFHSLTTKLLICSAVNGNANYCYTSPPLALHKHTTITVQQLQAGHNHQYYYQIFINKKRVTYVLNERPQIFKNVKYYASDPWYPAAKATIRHFNLAMYKHVDECCVS